MVYPYTKDTLLAYLDNKGFTYQLYEHPAVYTVEESRQYCAHIPSVHCKNLFLKDKKEQLWLVTAPDERVIDLKVLPEKIGSVRLSFARPELLYEHLGVQPGSVTPPSIINDRQHVVTPILDSSMMQQELLNFHPLINTATVAMRPQDVRAFMLGCWGMPRWKLFFEGNYFFTTG